jgi:hypothetical protein
MMGTYLFDYEVGSQLYYLAENYGVSAPRLNRSASVDVKDELDSEWENTLEFMKGEYEYEPTNSRKLKAIAYRYLSRGYNHVESINRRHGNHAFNKLFVAMKDCIDSGLKYIDAYDGYQVRVSYSFAKQLVTVSHQAFGFDDNDQQIEKYEILASNQ